MAHNKINIRLSQMIEASSFWKNPADHLMCDLTATFLVWSLRVTVEDSCTYLAVLITLDGQRVSELTSSIGEHHLKELLESFATKSLIEPVEYICYRPGCVGIAYECKHEFTVPEINCGTKNSASQTPAEFLLWGYEPRRGLEESETNKPPAMRVRIEG